MKKLIERFALFLLRKVGRMPGANEVSLGGEILFNGRLWTVYSWDVQCSGTPSRAKLHIGAVRNCEENAI